MPQIRPSFVVESRAKFAWVAVLSRYRKRPLTLVRGSFALMATVCHKLIELTLVFRRS